MGLGCRTRLVLCPGTGLRFGHRTGLGLSCRTWLGLGRGNYQTGLRLGCGTGQGFGCTTSLGLGSTLRLGGDTGLSLGNDTEIRLGNSNSWGFGNGTGIRLGNSDSRGFGSTKIPRKGRRYRFGCPGFFVFFGAFCQRFVHTSYSFWTNCLRAFSRVGPWPFGGRHPLRLYLHVDIQTTPTQSTHEVFIADVRSTLFNSKLRNHELLQFTTVRPYKTIRMS